MNDDKYIPELYELAKSMDDLGREAEDTREKILPLAGVKDFDDIMKLDSEKKRGVEVRLAKLRKLRNKKNKQAKETRKTNRKK